MKSITLKDKIWTAIALGTKAFSILIPATLLRTKFQKLLPSLSTSVNFQFSSERHKRSLPYFKEAAASLQQNLRVQKLQVPKHFPRHIFSVLKSSVSQMM